MGRTTIGAKIIALTSALVAIPLGAAAQGLPTFTVVPLDNAAESVATSINEFGDIGGYLIIGPNGQGSEAFRWSPFNSEDQFVRTGSFGGDQSIANAVLEDGSVIGEAETAEGSFFGFHHDAAMHRLSPLHDHTGSAAAAGLALLNGGPSIVGVSNASRAQGWPCKWKGFQLEPEPLGLFGYTSGEATSIDYTGRIVGWLANANGHTSTVILRPRLIIMPEPLEGHNPRPNGSSERRIVGEYTDTATGQAHGYVWLPEVPDEVLAIAPLPGHDSLTLLDVNNRGDVVGTGFPVGGAGSGIWGNAFGETADLNNLIDRPDDWRIESASGINDAGYIAATGIERATGKQKALVLVPDDALVFDEPFPRIAGRLNTFVVMGAQVDGADFLIWQRNFGRTAINGCDVAASMNSANIGFHATPDPSGRIEVDAFVGRAAQGHTLLLQFVEPETCRVSLARRVVFE